MPIRIRTTGTGAFRGHSTNIGFYEYTEGAMPHNVFDDAGEVGQLSFQVEDTDNNEAILLYRDNVELNDDFYGFITGSVNGFQYTNGAVEVTGTSRLNLINTEGYIAQQVTTIRSYITAILNAASITADIVIAPSVPSTAITVPGYEGNLWVLLKQFAALYQLDVSLIRNTIYVRPMREREISVLNVASDTLSLTEETFSRKFQVAYYNYERIVDELVFPYGGWTTETQVYQVEANETVTFDIDISGYLESVKQPEVQDFVVKDYEGPDSVYSVSANDKLPVTAEFWNDFGGDMSLEILENGTKLRITLTGPDFEEYSPYSISVSDGATEYSTLRLIGTGIFQTRETVTIPTGLTEADTPQEFGKEIDNPFITTRQQAYDAGVRARRRYALPRQIYESAGRRLEKPDFTEYDYLILDSTANGILDQNVLAYVEPEDSIVFFESFQTYAASLPSPYTFTNFNSDYNVATFQDFQDSVAEIITQAFGTISGSRVRFKDAFYRVVSTSVSQNETTVSAEYDTLISDFNTEFAASTFGDFTGVMVGLSFNDYALIPLRTETFVDYFTLDVSELDSEAVLAYG